MNVTALEELEGTEALAGENKLGKKVAGQEGAEDVKAAEPRNELRATQSSPQKRRREAAERIEVEGEVKNE